MSNKTCLDFICDGTEYYDEDISRIDDPEIFYNLSSLRRSALCWYPFTDGCSVLELSCGCGALTGLLCEKAGSVDAVEHDPVRAEKTRLRYSGRSNLSVILGKIPEDIPARQYDYIVAVGLADEMEGKRLELFKALRGHLAHGGKLLLGFRNRYALKYICGQIDDIVKRPGAAMDSSCPLLSKKNALDLVKAAGYQAVRSYYILPDFGFTQTVFSDEWMPADGVRERLLPYDPYGEGSSQRAKAELDRWDEIRDPLLARSLANAILLECSVDVAAVSKHITGAFISADREAEHAFCTGIYSDGQVQKRSLYPQGNKELPKIVENSLSLRRRGLFVVSQSIEHDDIFRYPDRSLRRSGPYIGMPYGSDVPLMKKIRELLYAEEVKAVAELFRQLWEDILRSSETCEKPANELSFAPGPVLETGFIDMIPFNAFWRDGRIVYYDQEFTVHGCPASYIIYRALRYTWLSISGAEKIIPLQKMKKMFGIEEHWDAFTRYEDEFTNRNRCRERFSQVYRWAWGEKPYKTGFIMGTFDLFHKGHLNLIRRAKERCEFLRVGVLSDELVFKYKNKMPVISLNERLEIVGAMKYVDEAIAIEGEYVSKIAEWYKRPYDCFFSGDDYVHNDYWKKEAAELEQLGSRIEFLPYTKEISTTMIREKLGRPEE